MTELTLLTKTQKVMKAEQKLTALLEKAEPWLTSTALASKKRSSKLDYYSERVRPIPTNMEQVDVILAMARNWSSKTSAPAGWDPQLAPVMGFATPSPLPHQLRGGALAALQLELATTQKYRSQQQQEEQALESKRKTDEDAKSGGGGGGGTEEDKKRLASEGRIKDDNDPNPKRRKNQIPGSAVAPQQLPRAAPRRVPTVEVTMNLSDSSSEDDDEDDDE
ncbi:hypothetical protein ACA910_011251 [Epithemia clementina (nom. ined.)]